MLQEHAQCAKQATVPCVQSDLSQYYLSHASEDIFWMVDTGMQCTGI